MEPASTRDPIPPDGVATSAPRLQCAGASDRGRLRPSNQDSFLVRPLPSAIEAPAYLLVVADGMGGHAGGEEASRIAVETVEATLAGNSLRWARPDREDAAVLFDLRVALFRADVGVADVAAQRPELRGMGTTVTVAVVLGARVFVAHAGDSSAYLRLGGALQKLTRDHTVVADMVASGELPARLARRHPMRHVVTNVVGGGERGVFVELHRALLAPGDALLLASDGLTDMIEDADIASVLAGPLEAKHAAATLIDLANDAGGRDNITVVIARFGA